MQNHAMQNRNKQNMRENRRDNYRMHKCRIKDVYLYNAEK